MKLCSKCKTIKTYSEFYVHNNHSDGYTSQCKVCIQASNKHKYQERAKNGTNVSSTKKVRSIALEKLGGVCVRCGFSDPRALQIDHVNGGGIREREAIGHAAIYRKVARGDTDGYQLLCANCNWIKRAENKEDGSSKNVVKPKPNPRP